MPKPTKLNVMIDSGAFSAWSRGASIDIKVYAEWLHRNRKWYDTCVNLDVIPGRGVSVEKAATESWRNWEALSEDGLEVIPVYHFGEDLQWLNRYVGLLAKGRILGLGGIAKAPAKHRKHWLTRVMGTCNDAGVRVHLFGVSAIDIVTRFKPYSFDSISAQQFAATGNVCVLSMGKVHKLHTGSIEGARATTINTLCKPLGVTCQLLKDHYWARARATAYALNKATTSTFIAGLSNRDYVRKAFIPSGCRNWLFSYWSIANREINLRECCRAFSYYQSLEESGTSGSEDPEVVSNLMDDFTNGKFDWSIINGKAKAQGKSNH